jgi:DNA-binding GntR family transcriptional regulator
MMKNIDLPLPPKNEMPSEGAKSDGRGRSRSQAADTYEVLRREILSCCIPPGSKILIGDICARLGFSSGAVREALSRLSAEGLVVAEPQRGFRAAPISIEDLMDLTCARAHLESLCLSEAMDKGGVVWEGRVLAAHHALSLTPMVLETGSKQMSEDWSLAHSHFHEVIAAGCGGRWLLRMRSSLYEQSERYRRLSLPLDQGQRAIAAEHKAICDAVIGRNKALATQIIKEHIFRTAEIIRNGFDKIVPA